MNSPNVEIVQRMYECFNRGDMDTIDQEIFAPDLVWRLPGHHPLAGVKNGAEEVIAFFGQLNRAGIQVDLIGIEPFGAVLDANNCTHYQIRDGKIANVQVYISDQHSVDNFFSAVYALKPIPDRLAS